MQRTNAVNARPDLNGAGKAGFHDNEDLSGVDATYLTPEFLNTVQEELVNILEKRGILLNPASKQQLFDALAGYDDLEALADAIQAVIDGMNAALAAEVLARQQADADHLSDANPHPQYVLSADLIPVNLFIIDHNSGSPYTTSFGYSDYAVNHVMESGAVFTLGNCLNHPSLRYIAPVTDYVIEGISLGGSLNKQGYVLKFDGYIQCGSYAGQGDTAFGACTAKLRFFDEDDEPLIDIPLNITGDAGFPNNGNVGHVTFKVSSEFDVYNLRKSDGSVPTTLKAMLLFYGSSNSDGGSPDLQILTVEGFSIVCRY